MKRLFILVLTLVFVSSFAFAQNTATITSEGNSNSATATQVGENTVFITQIPQGTDPANSNVAAATQTGLRNEGGITQTGQTHAGTILQEGNDHEATIRQSHWYGNAAGHIGSITQVNGNNNFADQWQRGANRDRAMIYQGGSDNEAWQDSRGASGTSNPAITEITQLGNDNYAYNYQNSSTWTHGYIVQEGNQNWVGLSQNLADNAEINQYGDRNKVADVTRTGDLAFVEGSNAYQHTSTIRITQGTELVSGDDNKVGFYQTGGAWADIAQDGYTNTSLLYQHGAHSSTIIQTGDINNASVKQTQSGHLGNITQTGNSNTALIQQSGL